MTDQEILNANLIAELGLQSLTDDQKLALLNDIATLVQKKAMVRIVGDMSSDQQEEMNALIEKEGAESEAVGAYLRETIPALDDIYKEELITVKKELMEKAKDIAS